MNQVRLNAESGKIAAGVDETALQPMFAKNIERTIDRETFRDAAQIDPDVGVVIADALAVQ